MIHGPILINEVYIGSWQAVPQEHPPQEVNSYKVEVEYRDPTGAFHEIETTLYHQYNQGALVLIREIMEWASQAIEEIQNDEVTC